MSLEPKKDMIEIKNLEQMQIQLDSTINDYEKLPVPVRASRIDVEAVIKTKEGDMRAKPGDYIVEGIHGEIYPVDKEIFLDTYAEKSLSPDHWMILTDIDPLKKRIMRDLKDPSIWRVIKNFRTFYKRYKGNLEAHVKYTGDPINEILCQLHEKSLSFIYEAHVKEAIHDGGMFLMYLGSCDSAYRPYRNLFLDWLTSPDIVPQIRKYLESEKLIEDYTNPDKWFDNMKWLAVNKTKKMQADGRLPNDAVCVEQASFIDGININKFHQKLRNNEL